MLLKWITCEVESNQHKAFQKAQSIWKQLKYAEGLVGQIGGWNSPNEACILSLWENQHSYDLFFENTHDSITYKNKQDQTYQNITVSFANSIIRIKGNAENITEAIQQAKVLRVADCIVHKEQHHHFVDMQCTIWNPEMNKHEGMLGGFFSVLKSKRNQFLITTLWRSDQDHENYKQNTLRDLQKKANIKKDLASIKGYYITLQSNWQVLPI